MVIKEGSYKNLRQYRQKYSNDKTKNPTLADLVHPDHDMLVTSTNKTDIGPPTGPILPGPILPSDPSLTDDKTEDPALACLVHPNPGMQVASTNIVI